MDIIKLNMDFFESEVIWDTSTKKDEKSDVENKFLSKISGNKKKFQKRDQKKKIIKKKTKTVTSRSTGPRKKSDKKKKRVYEKLIGELGLRK